jgi:hypothetical protein
MYLLMYATNLTLKVPRFAINTMVPFIVANLDLPRSMCVSPSVPPRCAP